VPDATFTCPDLTTFCRLYQGTSGTGGHENCPPVAARSARSWPPDVPGGWLGQGVHLLAGHGLGQSHAVAAGVAAGRWWRWPSFWASARRIRQGEDCWTAQVSVSRMRRRRAGRGLRRHRRGAIRLRGRLLCISNGAPVLRSSIPFTLTSRKVMPAASLT